MQDIIVFLLMTKSAINNIINTTIIIIKLKYIGLSYFPISQNFFSMERQVNPTYAVSE